MKLKRWEIVLEYRDGPDSEHPDYEKAYTKRYFTRRKAARRAAALPSPDNSPGITCIIRKCL